ncbi:MAG: T9SS type A sorting domain-containing protein [Flavobacteriales bacterium]|nr:T9SS type A sorting domain-containing protein [Flavobacteriales bacterium]
MSKKTICLFAALIVPFLTCNIQSLAQVTFQKTYAESSMRSPKSIQQTSDGGYILTGYGLFGSSKAEAYLLKVDANGVIEWTKVYGDGTSGPDNQYGNRVRQTNDRGYIVTGYTDGFGVAVKDIYVFKTDSVGNLEWAKTFGGSGEERGESVYQNVDGTYVIGGYTHSFPGADAEFYLLKLDGAGSLLWSKTYGGSGYDRCYSVQQTSDSGYVLMGSSTGFGAGSYDYYLVKTDSLGNEEWSKTYGGSVGDFGRSVQQTTDGGYFLSGFVGDYGMGIRAMGVVKTLSDGTQDWAKIYGGMGLDQNTSALQTNNGYIISGTSSSFGGSDMLLLKTDNSGVTEWSKIYLGTSDENAKVQLSSDGGYVICAATGNNFHLIKTDTLGGTGCNENNPATIDSVWVDSVTTPATIVGTPSTTENTITGSVVVTSRSPSTIVLCYDSTGCNLVVVTTTNDVDCFGVCTGSATAIPSGGTLPYTYTWSSGSTSGTADSLCAGIHIVDITDAAGCSTSDTITINEPPALNLNMGSADATCGNNDGKAWVIATGGTLPYSYLWDDSLSQTADTAFNMYAGSYLVTVTDTNGCTDSASAVVNNPGAPIITIDSTINVSCNGSNDGEIYIAVSGGILPYTYLWSNTDTIEDLNNLTAGSYTITVTESNNCSSVESITLTEPTVISSVTTIINNVSCNGFCDGSALVTISGGVSPYNYQWDDSLLQTTDTAISLCLGTYHITVTDSSGCTALDSVTITEPLPLSMVIASSTPSSCGNPNGEACITITGGTPPYTYLWDDPLNQTDSCAYFLAAGMYLPTVTDANNCSVTDTVTINDIPGPVIDSVATTDGSCFGVCDGTAMAYVSSGSSPFTFIWKNNVGDTIGTGLNPIGSLCGGTYTVTVIDVNVCLVSAAFTISEPTQLASTFISFNDASCNGVCDGSGTVTPSGGTFPYTYLWNDPLAQTVATADSLCAVTYFVTITDANGCSVTDSLGINEPTLLTVSGATTPSTCGSANGAGVVAPAGGTPPYSYSWNTTPVQTDSTATGLSAGTYTVTVTDFYNCMDITSVTITGPDSIILFISQDDALICYGSSTQISATATGGTGTYTFIWDNGLGNGSSHVVSPSLITVYTVAVQDANGCTAPDQSLTISVNPPLTTSVTGDTICEGDNGVLTVSASGGNGGPYYYTWLNDGSTNSFITVSPTITTAYTVVASDGCSIDDTTSVTVVVETCTGINNYADALNKTSLHVYPNPNTGEFVIEFNMPEKQNVEINLLNVSGQLVFEENIDNLSGLYQKTINLREFSKGVYTVQVVVNDGIITKKIIIE